MIDASLQTWDYKGLRYDAFVVHASCPLSHTFRNLEYCYEIK